MEHTLALVRARCYLYKMDANVESWCRSCERCTLAKAPNPKVNPSMGNFVATRPMEVLAVDFTVLDKSSDGYENVLIMPDGFYQVHQGGTHSGSDCKDDGPCVGEGVVCKFWAFSTNPQ